MSRSGGEPPAQHARRAGRRAGWALVLLAGGLGALALAAPAGAQDGGPLGFPLTAPVRRSLALLQQDWAEWLSAYERRDELAADGALERLRGGLAALGMSRLPELAVGASARAVEAARTGDFEWARVGLAAAEAADPGRPEIAFAAARVEWLARRPLAALVHLGKGYARAFGMPLERTLWLANLGLWGLVSLLVAGAVFVAVAMAARGPRLVTALLELLAGQFSRPTSYVLTALLLTWPALLPDGLLWLLLYWSVLLWAYGRPRERVLLLLLWIAVAAAPAIANEARRRVTVRLSPMVRALDDARAGRLQGELFGDLGRLRGVLPGHPAVLHALADQHRRLGQCEYARPLYRQVLDAEPENTAARLDLGICAFLRGEIEEAIEHFKAAAALDPLAVAPPFNLSLAYSELYRFAEAGAALGRAQGLDAQRVASWISEPGEDQAAAFDGGLERGEEVRRALLRSWALEDEDAESSTPWRQVVGFPIVFGCLLAALLFQRVAPQPRRHVGPPERLPRRPEIARRLLLPGLAELWAGRPLIGFAALLVPVALLLLLGLDTFGFRLPWSFQPPAAAPATLTAAGLVVYFVLRARRVARSV